MPQFATCLRNHLGRRVGGETTSLKTPMRTVTFFVRVYINLSIHWCLGGYAGSEGGRVHDSEKERNNFHPFLWWDSSTQEWYILSWAISFCSNLNLSPHCWGLGCTQTQTHCSLKSPELAVNLAPHPPLHSIHQSALERMLFPTALTLQGCLNVLPINKRNHKGFLTASLFT